MYSYGNFPCRFGSIDDRVYLPCKCIIRFPHRVPGFSEYPSFNVSNVTFPNTTMLSKYPVTPATVRVEVAYKETLPDVKGEMATGPRTIGVSLPAEVLMIGVVAIVAVVAGIGLIVWRRRTGNDEEK